MHKLQWINALSGCSDVKMCSVLDCQPPCDYNKKSS